MKRFLKIFLWSLFGLFLLMGISLAVFVYKVKYGFPVFYETEAPPLVFPEGQAAILLFSKTTGFRHSESIDASKPAFAEIARKNQWFLYETESGGVFNADQLAKFDVVIFNNSTGRVIDQAQKKALETYVENGGSLIGIHGSGDDSHHWDWYEQNLVGAKFSHHPLNPQFQEAALSLVAGADSTLSRALPEKWMHTDEWYVFFENPKKNGFEILYHIDGERIIPNGNILWVTSKNFGMGKEHPVAWYHTVGKGKTFYTSIGHTGDTWKNENFIQLMENAIRWAIR